MDPQLSPSSCTSVLQRETWRKTFILSFQAIGVVYGRMSISPLYVFGTIKAREFKSSEKAYEHFSFIFWTLTIVSLLKYAFIVLRADDDGEGGPFALYSLLCRHAGLGLLPTDGTDNGVMEPQEESPLKTRARSTTWKTIQKHKRRQYLLLFSALFGACMIIGDGVLTPSVSVLSASSGLQRSLEAIKYSHSTEKQTSIQGHLHKYVATPFACAILVCLFMLQQYGTHKIGFIFAPIVIVWMVFNGGVGLYNIIYWDHKILAAISPAYMFNFVKHIDKESWTSLASILLCVAGSEAMFADLGHFSKKSIMITFVSTVYPLLLLTYAGQAAFISRNFSTIADFNHLSESIPSGPPRHVFILLSFLATAVGSQATITASFSIINQCLALRCFPRVKVVHTSEERQGQVYIPDMNWLLMILSLTVTIGFHDTNKIASAAGLAIVLGMLVTTCLMSLVIAFYWEKSLFQSGCFIVLFGFVEGGYIVACLLNFHQGAWSLVVLVAIFFTVMLSWHYGTKMKYDFDLQNKVSSRCLTDLTLGLGVCKVPGIGFVYTDVVTDIPAFFSHFTTNLPAFHQVLIFVSFKSLPVPYVRASKRYLIGRVGARESKMYRCIMRYGYCDHIRDTDDFEEQIIRSIGEFISIEDNDMESQSSPEGRMIVVGKPLPGGNSVIRLPEQSAAGCTRMIANEFQVSSEGGEVRQTRRKMVRFLLPERSPTMRETVREELRELIDARESGAAYFLGKPHFMVQNRSNFMKKFLIKTYLFLEKNSREPPMALNMPHAALVEVGMVCTI